MRPEPRSGGRSHDGSRWSGRALVKYVLLQIPEFLALIIVLVLIQHWVVIPGWLIWGIVGFWIAKDAFLFPLLWRAYDSDPLKHVHTMIGRKGVAEERLAPSGYVKVRGELWRAEIKGEGAVIERGGRVRVLDQQGLTLLVEPLEDRDEG